MLLIQELEVVSPSLPRCGRGPGVAAAFPMPDPQPVVIVAVLPHTSGGVPSLLTSARPPPLQEEESRGDISTLADPSVVNVLLGLRGK